MVRCFKTACSPLGQLSLSVELLKFWLSFPNMEDKRIQTVPGPGYRHETQTLGAAEHRPKPVLPNNQSTPRNKQTHTSYNYI